MFDNYSLRLQLQIDICFKLSPPINIMYCICMMLVPKTLTALNGYQRSLLPVMSVIGADLCGQGED